MLQVIRATADRFHAVDASDPTFQIEGRLTNGSLTFTVTAEVAGHRGAVAGHEFFAAIMAHFGDGVERISATWTVISPKLLTNLDIFNAETRRGADKRQAAFRTKTGRWALSHGYCDIDGEVITTPADFPGG